MSPISHAISGLELYYNKVTNKLKTDVIITPQLLSELSWESLSDGVANHPDISSELASKIVNSNKQVHEAASKGAMLKGMATQGLFFLPDIIRAANSGDISNLEQTGAMMAGDAAINHLYSALINKLATIMPAGRAELLGKLPVTSPIFKALTIYSIVELHKQLASLPANSEERSIIKHKLGEQYVTAGLMVAELLGFEVTPLWIGLIAEQLIFDATSFRKQNHLEIPFWEALAMSLGFEQDKLQNILEERQLVEMNLALVNQINNQTQIPYGLTIVKIPKLGKLKWYNITQDQIPAAISNKINNMQEEVISKINSPGQRILASDGLRQVNNYQTINNDFAMDGDVSSYRGQLISSIWQKASYDAYPQKSKLKFALHHNNMNSFKHEDNIFLDQLLVENVNYQRIPSKATGIFLNGQDVLKRNEAEAAAVYISTEAYRNANAQSNFYVGFDPREGDIELDFTSQGLERIDTMNVMRYFVTENGVMHHSLNGTSPYMITVQVANKPYPGSLEFSNRKGEFFVQDNSQRIISQYVINDNIDYVIKDFTSATRISFMSNLAQQEMCTTIRSEPNTIFILKWQCNNKMVNDRNQIEYLNLTDMSGKILISEDKKYLQLVLNNHVIDNHLRISAEHVDIIEAQGRLDKNSKIDIMQAVNSFNITLRGDIIVSDQATYLQMSGEVANILPAIIYAKSAHNKVIALYEFNLDNLQPILETMLRSNNSEFMDIKFSSNDVQYHWHNKLPINNTLQLAGRLDGKRGLLQIEAKSDTLRVFNDDNSIATTQVAHYDASAMLEDGLILQKVFRTIEPNVTVITNSELVTNTDNGNMLEFSIGSYYGKADVLEFQTPAGYLLYHYFPINRTIKLNNINYIVKNQMICASAAGQDIIDGHELIKYGAISNLGNMEKMVGICFPQSVADSKILVKNDTLQINDLTLKSLEDSTKLYFSETEILSVKTLKDSLTKNQISNITTSSTKYIDQQTTDENREQEYLVNLNNSSRTINYNQLNKATIILNNIKTVKTGELKVTASNNDLLFVASGSNHTLRIKNWPANNINNTDHGIITLKFDQLSPAIEIRAINKLKLSEIAKIQNLVSKAELSYEITKQLEQLDNNIVNDLKYLLVSNHKVGLTGNNHCLGFKNLVEQQEFISSYGKNYNQQQLQKILNHDQIIKALTWLIAKDYNDLSLQEPSQEKIALITAISKCYKEVISGKIIHRLLKHLEEGHAIAKIERFIKHHEPELKQKITAEFKASKVTSSAFITKSITEVLDSEIPQHVRSRRAIDAQNEHDDEIENISDIIITSTASSMPSSPMNNMINWFKTNVVGVLLSNVLNPVNKINWFTAENIKSSSIDAAQIADSRTNNTTENSASIKSVDYGQFNLNDSLTLADLIIRKITKVKPYITKEEPLNLLELQAQVLNIIAGFEEILEEYAQEKDILMAELEFDPITLQMQLISEIVNGNHSNIVEILSKSLEKTQLATKATELKNHLQDKITVMLKKQQDMLLANEPLIDNRQNNQFNNQSKIENTDIVYNIAEIENYANVTTNCQPDVGLIG
ncbi:hypothetical protein [Rickettsia endosymbiont of Polydrusus tereticollis]|uniref:hypothetical protein n=1 Tax=Rickettsia endosymbiont of Polydrusus tereticollis TaxID=3066251 RepID=UPI003132CF84